MSESSQQLDITFYISIISSCLLAISEILPYIKSINSNGVIECIETIIKTLINKNYIQIPEQSHVSSSVTHLISPITELTNEIRSYKQIFQLYLNDKKINISIN